MENTQIGFDISKREMVLDLFEDCAGYVDLAIMLV
jgi:hypothetical protein